MMDVEVIRSDSGDWTARCVLCAKRMTGTEQKVRVWGQAHEWDTEHGLRVENAELKKKLESIKSAYDLDQLGVLDIPLDNALAWVLYGQLRSDRSRKLYETFNEQHKREAQ